MHETHSLNPLEGRASAGQAGGRGLGWMATGAVLLKPTPTAQQLQLRGHLGRPQSLRSSNGPKICPESPGLKSLVPAVRVTLCFTELPRLRGAVTWSLASGSFKACVSQGGAPCLLCRLDP